MKKFNIQSLASIRVVFLAGAVIAIGLFTFAAILTGPADQMAKLLNAEKEESEEKGKDGPREVLERDIQMMKDPALGSYGAAARG